MATEPVAVRPASLGREQRGTHGNAGSYTPDDPDWLDWQAGRRFDPEKRWASWSELIRATVARGVSVRRIRLVSEPVTDYIRFVTTSRPRITSQPARMSGGCPGPRRPGSWCPASDFWVLDGQVVLWNHFAGDGSWVGEGRCDDPAIAKLCASSFDAAWDRAIPHEAYQPA